ncbi:enhanced disease resistance 2-like protein [Tanacetum coccineum]
MLSGTSESSTDSRGSTVGNTTLRGPDPIEATRRSTWMAFGGNIRGMGSFGEETDEITDLHQILEEVLLTERGDGVAGIKRRRRDPSSDGVRDLVTASGRRDQHSAVFYFATDDVIPTNSLLYRFINGDDSFRNSRFKMVNRIVKGPWLVRTAVGGYSACLLGKALNCHYYRGDNYLEIDVDIGSSKIATAILHLALGCVNSVTIDMGFVVEAVEEEELPERLLGAVRICQMEMSSATVVSASGTNKVVIPGGVSSSRVANDGDDGK